MEDGNDRDGEGEGVKGMVENGEEEEQEGSADRVVVNNDCDIATVIRRPSCDWPLVSERHVWEDIALDIDIILFYF